LLKADRSQADLARYLDVPPPTINKMIHGNRRILATEAEKIRRFFGLPAASSPGTRELPTTDTTVTVPFASDLKRDLPIMGVVSGGTGGLAQLENGSASGYALRPARLAGRTDVAAFWVEDPSAGDAHPPGSLVVAERKRPPQIGEWVIFELLPETVRDERIALIKRYLGRTPTVYKFEQLQPPKRLEYPVKRIASLMRVIPLAELLGV
jgi:hypothetical protein